MTILAYVKYNISISWHGGQKLNKFDLDSHANFWEKLSQAWTAWLQIVKLSWILMILEEIFTYGCSPTCSWMLGRNKNKKKNILLKHADYWLLFSDSAVRIGQFDGLVQWSDPKTAFDPGFEEAFFSGVILIESWLITFVDVSYHPW